MSNNTYYEKVYFATACSLKSPNSKLGDSYDGGWKHNEIFENNGTVYNIDIIGTDKLRILEIQDKNFFDKTISEHNINLKDDDNSVFGHIYTDQKTGVDYYLI
ncbi:hypothetical protein [Candidatus Sulfurimonas baltica]|uniref:Uncharacterized protein n=1 Tax=Candidatus Sulfurimonas baltica TaxID=2740404 RepID=A0A7S7RP91_9BACT|nr:hypothetical protein [Candidatus Sulfurimonas baltica]QOY53248.1 hypothetical protein HUE88_06090 [Candidatus Sulfurimonas baltica]